MTRRTSVVDSGHSITTEGREITPEPQVSGPDISSVRSNGSGTKRKIWIDIDNSPHVPFFLPIIEELEKRGFELILTARDMYQVCELLEFFNLRCKVIGEALRQEQSPQGPWKFCARRSAAPERRSATSPSCAFARF